MKNKYIYVGLGVIVVGLLSYALKIGVFKESSQNVPANQGQKIQVSTSFYPLYFFTSQIAGDKAVVYNIIPSGAEPHDYEPTTQDIARVEDGQLLVLNGGKLEAWGDKVKDTLKGTNTQVITVGDDLANQTVVEDGNTIRDPHVWLDPPLAKKETAAIAQGLATVDPSNASFYQANAQALETKLDSLDAEFRQGLNNCQKKDIITSHAAFGYLAREYGLNQVPISGLSPDAEPSPQQLAQVADFAKKNNVKYIFFESLVSPKLSQTIANEVGAQTMVLNPIEGLSDDEIHSGKTYFTEMDNNLANLKTVLQCQ